MCIFCSNTFIYILIPTTGSFFIQRKNIKKSNDCLNYAFYDSFWLMLWQNLRDYFNTENNNCRHDFTLNIFAYTQKVKLYHSNPRNHLVQHTFSRLGCYFMFDLRILFVIFFFFYLFECEATGGNCRKTLVCR